MSRRESMSLSQEEYEQLLRKQLVRGGDATSTGLASSRNDNSGDFKVASANKKAGAMNKTELAYSLELEARKQAGEILWWGFEAIKLKLAGGTFYTPDFAVMAWVPAPTVVRGQCDVCSFPGSLGQISASRLHFVETKGFLRDDANVKFKVAAERFPWAEFFMYRKRKANEGGGWELMKHLNGGAR